MKGRRDSPLPQGMKENVVRRATLVAMELVEQSVTWVELVWVLKGRKTKFILILSNLHSISLNTNHTHTHIHTHTHTVTLTHSHRHTHQKLLVVFDDLVTLFVGENSNVCQKPSFPELFHLFL